MSDDRSILQVPDGAQIRLVPPGPGLDPLPRPLTSFVGRENELGAILRLLDSDDVRLLTLSGPGGAGKTRLALRTASHLEPQFPDGVAFVGLDAATDPALVPVLIAQAAGVPDVQGQPLSRRMRNFFRTRDMLLVLDNLEHLPGTALVIADLLAASERLKVLCTSRIPLGISPEHVFPVPPLVPDDATALFEQRARAVQPDFPGFPATIATICERLEHLPLAIELAAARVTLLPLPALLARLEHQLPLLTGGPRDAPARHRTMRDTIAWSHQLLEPGDQVLLRRLAVFAGGFSLDAAQEIATGGVDILDGISRLVASGLARPMPGPAGDPRFRLPVVIREFADEALLASGEADTTRHWHATYYRNLAEAYVPFYDRPGNPAYRNRIVAERANCRTAMEWAMASGEQETAIRLAGALWRTWWPTHAIGGRAWSENLQEGLDWIDRTLLQRADLPLEVIAEGLIGAGALNIMLGQYPASRGHASGLLKLSEEQRFPYGTYWACFQLGRIAQGTGDLDLAHMWMARAVDMSSVIRDADNHASMALGCLGDIARARGNHAEASRLAEEAVRCARASGNPHNISWLSLTCGRSCLERGEFSQAVRYLIESARAYAEDEDPGGIRTSMTELGRVALALDRVETAAALLVAVHDLPVHAHDRPIHDATMADLASRLNVTPEELVGNGEAELPLDELLNLARSLETAPTPPSQPAPSGLTSRELDVLKHVAAGRSNRAIADALSISERTVENHVCHILAKLDLDSRTAAATWAVRQGLD